MERFDHSELFIIHEEESVTEDLHINLNRISGVHEDYLDVIFVAKGPKIGILVVLHVRIL